MDDSKIYFWDRLPSSEVVSAQTHSEIRFGNCLISIVSSPERESWYEESGEKDSSMLKIWNEETAELVAIFDMQYPRIAIAVYPDASMIVFGGRDTQLHFCVLTRRC